MENLLSKFQVDLGSISSEIQILQDKSLSLSTRLKNRKEVKGELGNFLDELTISPQLISYFLFSMIFFNYFFLFFFFFFPKNSPKKFQKKKEILMILMLMTIIISIWKLWATK